MMKNSEIKGDEEKIKYRKEINLILYIKQRKKANKKCLEKEFVDNNNNNIELIIDDNKNFRTIKKDCTIYCKLINVINPPPLIKGSKMNLNAIKYMIQESTV